MVKDKNYKIMQTFEIGDLPNLDVCVLGALELFSKEKLPKMKIPYKRPLVVGSGNAEATGKIIFRDIDAVFASESNYENKLKNIKDIDGLVLVSASGGKHAPIIAKVAKKYKKEVILLTNNSNSLAKKYVKEKDIFVFPKQREPYTYNTSTYMGMILGKTKENPKKIHKFISKNTAKLKFPNFKKYKRYYLLIPEEFDGIIDMLQIKFIELFGRQIARDIRTFEYIKHATTVVPSKDELFISFGKENKIYGKNRFHVPLPKDAGYAAMMAVGYYVVAQIQKTQEPWFKKNIVEYTKEASKIFKQEIKPIVE